MRKIIIASHHKMASGLKDTLEFIAGEQTSVLTIDAYLDNEPLDDTLKEIFVDKSSDDEYIIFTDLKAGSVNQAFIKYLALPHVLLVTGMNLPIILSVLLAPSDGYLEEEQMQHYIDEAKQEVVFMNAELANLEDDDDDE